MLWLPDTNSEKEVLFRQQSEIGMNMIELKIYGKKYDTIFIEFILRQTVLVEGNSDLVCLSI